MDTIVNWFPALQGPIAAGLELYARLSSRWIVVQLAVILVGLALAFLFNRRVSRAIKAMAEDSRHGSFLRRWRREIIERVTPFIFLVLIWLALLVLDQFTWSGNTVILRLVASLTTAWIVINILALAIRNRFLYRVVSVGLWLLAAASILGILPEITATLDGMAFTLGSTRVSALRIIQAIALMGLLFWLTGVAGRFLDGWLARIHDITPSLRVLIGKLTRVVLYVIAALVAISVVGIDLTALAVFSGALGLGIGLGLQKSVSNFVAGITVLADKSIKPGDVISLGETFGWITALKARYVSVVTRDGREHLIPNETFVTETVINWSYTDAKVRIEVPFSASYAANPHQVKALVEGVCPGVPRVLPVPKPIVHFTGMGESSLDFIARVWLVDPVDGLANVRSALLLAIWDVLTENGIEIPYPQRDLHFRDPLVVRVDQAERPHNRSARAFDVPG
jgi:small-conductance mechanosensitive channel